MRGYCLGVENGNLDVTGAGTRPAPRVPWALLESGGEGREA